MDEATQRMCAYPNLSNRLYIFYELSRIITQNAHLSTTIQSQTRTNLKFKGNCHSVNLAFTIYITAPTYAPPHAPTQAAR